MNHTFQAAIEPCMGDDTLRRQTEFFEQHELSQTFLHAIPDCAVIINASHQIVYVNRRFLDLIGIAKDAIIGKRFGEAIALCELQSKQRGMWNQPALHGLWSR